MKQHSSGGRRQWKKDHQSQTRSYALSWSFSHQSYGISQYRVVLNKRSQTHEWKEKEKRALKGGSEEKKIFVHTNL